LGGTIEESGWLPLCVRCNHGEARRIAALSQRIKRSSGGRSSRFLSSRQTTGQLSRPNRSQKGQRRLVSVNGSVSSEIQPRLITPPTGDSTLGLNVTLHAAGYGVKLMPWQQIALDHVLATQSGNPPNSSRDSVRLCHRQGLISVARQNGKSTIAEALIKWWLEERTLTHGKQTVVLATHDLRLTSVMFERICTDLERRGLVEKTRWSHGRQDCELTNGSRLYVASNSPSAGHGLSVDLVVVDECWDITEACLDQGLLPSQRARPEPFCLLLSTAGDEGSALFRRWREHGLALIDQQKPGVLAMAEWSPPAGVDPLDEQWWSYANPAMGHTITMEALRAEAQGPNRNAFMRASLNLWIFSAKSWLEGGVWEANKVGALSGADSGGVLSIESSLDGKRFVGVRAVLHERNSAFVGVEFIEADEHMLWKRVSESMLDPKLELACTPALDVHLPPALEKRRTVVSTKELARWTPLVRSAINGGRVLHKGEHALSEHVNRAVLSRTEGGEQISTTRSPGPVELARCMVWAVALVTRPTWQRKAAIGGAK
jgi:hypothetical protein